MMSCSTQSMLGVVAAALLMTACAPSESHLKHEAQATQAQNDAHSRGGAYRPPSQSGGVRAQAFVPGRPGRVFIFAGVDVACRPLPAPDVTVTRAPAKGDVSLRPGQETTLAASVGGTCIGAKTNGTGVYYTPRIGTSGGDSFTVSGRLVSGETMTREFAIEIAQ